MSDEGDDDAAGGGGVAASSARVVPFATTDLAFAAACDAAVDEAAAPELPFGAPPRRAAGSAAAVSKAEALRLSRFPSADRAARGAAVPLTTDVGVNVTTCGHAAHVACAQQLLRRAAARLPGAHGGGGDEAHVHLRTLTQGCGPSGGAANFQGEPVVELCCPLCRGLSNMLYFFVFNSSDKEKGASELHKRF
jgi:hypothetical protein